MRIGIFKPSQKKSEVCAGFSVANSALFLHNVFQIFVKENKKLLFRLFLHQTKVIIVN